MRCEQLIEDFLNVGWLNCQWSRNTIQTYRKELLLFSKWLKSSQNKKLINTTQEDVALFIEFKAASRVSTHNLRISVMRYLFKHLVREHKMELNPCAGQRLIRSQSSLPDVLSEMEAARLMVAPDTTTRIGLRDKVVLELLYATGIRVSELVMLEMPNLHLLQRYIIVRAITSKSRADRIVPFGSIASDWLSAYLNEIRPGMFRLQSAAGAGSSRVFLGKGQGGGLSVRTCRLIIKRHAKGAGISRRVYPHILRHSFATHLLNGGANLIVIQKLLGHASVQTTQIYTHTAIERLHRVHEKHHPRGAKFNNPHLEKGRHFGLYGL